MKKKDYWPEGAPRICPDCGSDRMKLLFPYSRDYEDTSKCVECCNCGWNNLPYIHKPHDIVTELKRIEDNTPVMHGVNIIIKYDVGNPIGDYTIGWKKQIGKNTYGDYIRVTDGRDIKDVMREYFPLMVEQIEQVIETVSEKGGGEV